MSKNQPQNLWFSEEGLTSGRIIRWDTRHFGTVLGKGTDGAPEEFFIHRNTGFFVRPVGDHLEWVAPSFPGDVLPEPKVNDKVVFVASDEKPEKGKRRPVTRWAYQRNIDAMKKVPTAKNVGGSLVYEGTVLKYPFQGMRQGFFNVSGSNNELFFDRDDHCLPVFGPDGSIEWIPEPLNFVPPVGTPVKFMINESRDRAQHRVERASPWCLATEWQDAQKAAPKKTSRVELDPDDLQFGTVYAWNPKCKDGRAVYVTEESREQETVRLGMLNQRLVQAYEGRLWWVKLPSDKEPRNASVLDRESVIFLYGGGGEAFVWAYASDYYEAKRQLAEAQKAQDPLVDFDRLFVAAIRIWNGVSGEATYWDGESFTVKINASEGRIIAPDGFNIVWRPTPAGKSLRTPKTGDRIVFAEIDGSTVWTSYNIYRKAVTELLRSGKVEMEVYLQHSDGQGRNPKPAHLEWGGTDLSDPNLTRVWDPDPRHDTSHYVHDDFTADKWFQAFVNDCWHKLDFDPRQAG